MICLGRWVDHLLLVVGQGGRRDRHTGGANERVVGRGAEDSLAHVGRITQNRTGWHLTWQTSDRPPVLRQVEGDRGRRLIVIGGREEFLLLDGHEFAFDLALYASLARLAGGIGRGALQEGRRRSARAAGLGHH